jgi:hypothetical protein
MIDRVVGNKLLPASIRQDIVERTDGIPLFVEGRNRGKKLNDFNGDEFFRHFLLPNLTSKVFDSQQTLFCHYPITIKRRFGLHFLNRHDARRVSL